MYATERRILNTSKGIDGYYTCEFCGKRYRWQTSLCRHLREVHKASNHQTRKFRSEINA